MQNKGVAFHLKSYRKDLRKWWCIWWFLLFLIHNHNENVLVCNITHRTLIF